MLRIERTYRISDGDKQWSVLAGHLKEVDDETYVKLVRSGRGYASLVFNNNDNMPHPTPADYSLTASASYDALVQLRNEATRHHVVASSGISKEKIVRWSAKQPSQAEWKAAMSAIDEYWDR